MYCMYCGEEIPDKSRYCKYCGKLVAEDEIRTVNSVREEKKSEAVAVENNTLVEEVAAENDALNGAVVGTENNALNEEVVATENVINNTDAEALKDNVSDMDILIENAMEKVKKEEIPVVEDFFFQHISSKKKVALFLLAVFMIAIIAVVVFVGFFPHLI